MLIFHLFSASRRDTKLEGYQNYVTFTYVLPMVNVERGIEFFRRRGLPIFERFHS